MSQYDQLINTGRNDGCGGGTYYNSDSTYIWVGDTSNGFFRFLNIPVANGGTIDSAYIEFYTHDWGSSNNITCNIKATDEDSAAELPASSGTQTDPMARARTTASVSINIPATRNTKVTSGDIKSVIQEIVDRPGWSGGGNICIVIEAIGGSSQNDLQPYEYSSTKCMRLVINYTSTSTYTKSLEASASITKSNTDYGLKITKPTYEVDTDDNPSHFIFDSSLGTLKYFTTGSVDLELVDVEYQGSDSVAINHNLGYIPYVEVYVQNYLDEWEPCPSVGSGASVFWQLTYAITTTQIIFYASVYGDFTETFSFTFKYFIFKNELTF